MMSMKEKNFEKILAYVVLAILVFSVIGATAALLKDSSDSITNLNDCTSRVDASGNPLVYNTTSGLCDNESDHGVATPAAILPMQSLVGETGILVAMAFIMMGIVLFVIKRMKTK